MNTKNGIEWIGIDEEWSERIQNNFWGSKTNLNLEHHMKKEDIEMMQAIQKKLFDFAGEEVCLAFFNPKSRSNQLFLKYARYVSKENIEASEYLPSRMCHSNASYVSSIDPSVDVFTGFYMDKQGMWREHTWGFSSKTGNIIEATREEHCYFGYNLSEIEGEEERFIQENLTDSDLFEIEEHLSNNEKISI